MRVQFLRNIPGHQQLFLNKEITNPEPGTRNPEPGTWNPEPGTWNPEPGTWNPEPGTWELTQHSANLFCRLDERIDLFHGVVEGK
jgi:hypothetical protein